MGMKSDLQSLKKWPLHDLPKDGRNQLIVAHLMHACCVWGEFA